MQPPIPLGTLLQKRYRVTKVLGQGGFGRTYLAQDTACFDEPCVLKEFTPNERGRDSLRKARELFQREAKALYQINHPQIPRFRANFEEAKRLFLVQEYAEGKTYAKILGERIRESRTFTEEEAISFLQHMLPVLENIHSQGIIHRDISPDNIILRESDQLPVLIDFGVVKAGVQNLEAEGSEVGQQGTTVGKAGYAPNEQLQTGEAYANSDLYALAVTVVVMMTGRKPESLIDKATMTWKWQQWLPTISPWFAKVLMRMMSYRPNNRYQSAKEVHQALRSVADLVGNTSGFLGDGNPTGATTSGYVTSGHTSPNSPQASGNRYTTYTPKQHPRSQLWTNPLVLAIAGGFIILIPFMLFRSLIPSEIKPVKTNISPSPVPSEIPIPSPAVTESPAPLPSVLAQPSPLLTTEVLTLIAGQPPAIKESSLVENQVISYQISGLQPTQKLSAKLEGNAQMSILAPNKVPVDFQAQKVAQWQGTVPAAGDYYVEVTLPSGVTSGNFKLIISTSNAVNPLVSPSPAASPLNLPGNLVPSNNLPLVRP